MELISTIILLSIFLFFYIHGRGKNNWVFELLGSVGFLLMGILLFATQLQIIVF